MTELSTAAKKPTQLIHPQRSCRLWVGNRTYISQNQTPQPAGDVVEDKFGIAILYWGSDQAGYCSRNSRICFLYSGLKPRCTCIGQILCCIYPEATCWVSNNCTSTCCCCS